MVPWNPNKALSSKFIINRPATPPVQDITNNPAATVFTTLKGPKQFFSYSVLQVKLRLVIRR